MDFIGFQNAVIATCVMGKHNMGFNNEEKKTYQ